MLFNTTAAVLDPQTLYSANNEFWAITDIKRIDGFGIYAIEMRKLELDTWELGSIVKSFHKDLFLDGSGHGGSAYFQKDLRYKIKTGIIYREVDLSNSL